MKRSAIHDQVGTVEQEQGAKAWGGSHFQADATAHVGRFSFTKFSDKNTILPISLDEDIVGLSRTFANKPFKVNLDDQNNVGSILGIGYRESYALIASIKQNNEKGVDSPVKLTLVSSKGPEVKFRLET